MQSPQAFAGKAILEISPVRRVGNGEALPTRLPDMNADYPLALSQLRVARIVEVF